MAAVSKFPEIEGGLKHCAIPHWTEILSERTQAVRCSLKKKGKDESIDGNGEGRRIHKGMGHSAAENTDRLPENAMI